MVRSEQPRRGDPLVAAAVHQRRDHVVEHHPGGDAAAVTAPRVVRGELRLLIDPIRAANSTHNGSMMDAGSRGTDPSSDLETSAIP
jgi:hypothetical protein